MNSVTIKSQSGDAPSSGAGARSSLKRLLFIHHSCGGQWLSATGPEIGTNCIYRSHPNGGGLRARLEQNHYMVIEASYGSRLGEKTGLFDWMPKFRDYMLEILTCGFQDERSRDGRTNDVVVFKSCFSNNQFRSEGSPPGNPVGPTLTVWNAKAAYTSLLREFGRHPEVLFVYVTAPPLAAKMLSQPGWKNLAKKILRRDNGHKITISCALARKFNNWLAHENGWLKDYQFKNVVVFDYYDILTRHGVADFCAYPTGGGYDSHPSREGNEKATAAFVPFLNQAVRSAGLAVGVSDAGTEVQRDEVNYGR